MTKGRRRANRHGYVVIDKPAGWTSHDVVARVRRILGERRVGHAGTLDPAAVGVLPIAVGLATRTVEYLAEADKSYRADVTFGITTDSSDADGIVTGIADASCLTASRLEAVLRSALGRQLQTPPMHSAVKIGGKRLYQLAREGRSVSVPPREIVVHALEPVDWRPPTLTLDITCSKGTYVRSLARDLGTHAGTGAYLSHLVRTHSGPFTIDDAVSLDVLALLHETLGWAGMAFHPDWVLQNLHAVVLDDPALRLWTTGQPVAHGAIPTGTVRVYDSGGVWLGVGEAEAGIIRSTKVILPE